MVYGEYWGCGMSNGRMLKFHWTSTAANIDRQLEFIKRRLDIQGNISYHFYTILVQIKVLLNLVS